MPTRRHVLATAVGATTVGLLVGAAPWASAGHTNAVLTADLDGRQEINPVTGRNKAGDRRGEGEAYVFGIDGDPTTLCYVLVVDDIAELDQAPLAGTRMAHIHEGAAGTNGPVVANLAWPQDGQAADCITEGEEGKFPTGETVAEILADPAAYYVNVHNAAFPGGAIRGQLEAQAPR